MLNGLVAGDVAAEPHHVKLLCEASRLLAWGAVIVGLLLLSHDGDTVVEDLLEVGGGWEANVELGETNSLRGLAWAGREQTN